MILCCGNTFIRCSPICVSGNPSYIFDSSLFSKSSTLSYKDLSDFIIEEYLNEVLHSRNSKVGRRNSSGVEGIVEPVDVSKEGTNTDFDNKSET